MVRGWMLKGKMLRMLRWKHDWLVGQGLATSCMAMALTWDMILSISICYE